MCMRGAVGGDSSGNGSLTARTAADSVDLRMGDAAAPGVMALIGITSGEGRGAPAGDREVMARRGSSSGAGLGRCSVSDSFSRVMGDINTPLFSALLLLCFLKDCDSGVVLPGALVGGAACEGGA